MKLNNKGLENKNAWEAAGYALPQYDREAVAARTKQNPFWIHFGAGNIFRAFQANVVQDLLNKGDLDRGLVVAEGYDYEIVEKMNHPHDDYSILVTLKANGTVEKTVVGSVMESPQTPCRWQLLPSQKRVTTSTVLTETSCRQLPQIWQQVRKSRPAISERSHLFCMHVSLQVRSRSPW